MRTTTTFILFLFAIINLNGQSVKQKADTAFESLKYQDAIKLYTKYLTKEKDREASENLAQAYYYNGQYQEAQNILIALIEESDHDGPQILKLAKVLLLNNEKDKAISYLELYIIKHPSTPEYKRLFESAKLEDVVENMTYSYQIYKSAFNSDVSDFSPIYYNEKILFTSQRGGKTDPWTGRSFSNIYLSDKDGSDAKQLSGNLNGKFHNGAVTFINESEMLFTRNNSKKGSNRDYNLILALAKKKGNDWKFAQEFTYNNKDYSNAYPTYIKQSNTLIFSSDQPGGQGGMDLYTSKYANGSWSIPVNLGDKINTDGDEVFAYASDDYLYFASNGFPGLGGLDIFRIALSNLSGGEIEHLEAPLNSNRDDFGLITDDALNSGYLSSNREGTGSVDNIYYYKKDLKELPPQPITISGIVIDQYTKIPLKETKVSLKNVNDDSEILVTTGDDGRFVFEGLSGESYNLSGMKNAIATTSAEIKSANVTDNYYFTLLHNDPRFSLEGFAINNKTQQGVEGVKVICFNKSNQQQKAFTTDVKGFFKFQLNQDSDFEISGTKGGYYTSVSEASTQGLDRSTTLYVKLFLNVEEVIIGETKILGKEQLGGHDFDQVYYDLNKANIRPDAALALDKVVSFLVKNPDLKVELGSHTDCRAKDDYNYNLSNRRAASAVQYVISKGIDSSRIQSKGYGESNLINHCADGIKCSEALHQLNRRTEIKIIGM